MITNSNYSGIIINDDYMEQVPYDVTPRQLYSAARLYAGYRMNDDATFSTCYDASVYRHFIQTGKRAHEVRESLARALHDHCMAMALETFLADHDKRHTVGIMGGHALQRTDKMFREIVLIAKQLTEQGCLMLTGGGPGAMEAAHLGAWMAGRRQEETDDALTMLAKAPCFEDAGWLSAALQVMERYPQHRYQSLGIPTWLYGHEPSTPFATHIAKFFENSLREDGILTYAFGGIIYTPGSAGTMQEIFQDAVQNHYLSFGFSSPMVFLGQKFWTEEMPVYPLLQNLMQAGRYKNLLLSLYDEPKDVVNEIIKFSRKRQPDLTTTNDE
jgi:predicted Rossmann-fold nucleotide-binding protein